MDDDKKIIRLFPNQSIPKPQPIRDDLEREIEVLKTTVLSLTEEVRALDRILRKLIRGLRNTKNDKA